VTYVALFTQAELEAFVGAEVVRRILDDDRNGTADTNAVTAIIQAASSHVLAAYYQTFDEVPEVGSIPARLGVLAKLAGKAYLAIRHEEYVRYNGLRLLEYVDKQLDALVAGNRRIGESGPDPADNHGGLVMSGDPEFPDIFDPFMVGNQGGSIF
jgi:hypothetical protein